jgi:hypothetical protein
VTLLFHNPELFIWGMTYQLGRMRRNLAELKEAGLLCNETTDLAALGYENNYGVAPDENLLGLASGPFAALLKQNRNPQALIVHHAYAENACVRPEAAADPGYMPHTQYFPAALMRSMNVSDMPYLGSFATGCTGLVSLIITASGFGAYSAGGPVICLTADVKPAASTYDAFREKILTSDCSSGFFIGSEKCGYQVLGASYYSTKKTRILLIDIVKRSVQMIRELAKALEIDLGENEVVMHYPNAFPEAWTMVTNYLKAGGEPPQLDGLAERAHCLSSDSVITLGKLHRGEAGRLHVVVNFGAGIHLGVCILREEASDQPAA